MTEFIHENIRLIHGDCMDYMKDLPDNVFDLAIVDPPYGINFAKTHTGKGWVVRESKDWDKNVPGQKYFDKLFKVSKNQIIFGANYMTQFLPPSQGWIFWDKGQRDFSLADGELAFSSFDRALRVFKFTRSQMQSEYNGNKFHPTTKPTTLYKWLLKNYATPDMKIIDTHLGSGSSAIAAWEYKCKEFVGIEIDKEYYDAGVKRFKNHIAQKKLF